MRLVGLVVLSWAALLASADAFAAKSTTALDKEAKKACLSGDYLKGVSILADLYVDTGDATYLYNQGRCYEQNVRYVEAAERFREYMRKARKLTNAERNDVENHIAECETAIAKARPTEPPAPLPVAPQPQPQFSPPQPEPQPQPLVREVATSAPATRPWQHTAKWVAAGVAVAALGLGVTEHIVYYGKNKDYNDNPLCGGAGEPESCRSLASSGDTAQILSLVGYGAAAVATGLAVTFWIQDKPVVETTRRSAVSLTCAPGVAGLSCFGRF
jgi:hypothetical protein